MPKNPIEFYKVHGCGNDFICIDIRTREYSLKEMEEYAKILCTEHFSIGADGIVFIDTPTSEEHAYRWHFYNSDGSRASMCGNASRCVGYLASYLGIASKEHSFETDAGIIHVSVEIERSWVKTQLTFPVNPCYNQELAYEDTVYTIHSIDTGVPHAVVFVDDIDAIDVHNLGKYFRYHEHFTPSGTNVNFVEILSNTSARVRTYERGVEGETHACGTGVSAVAYIGNALGLLESSSRITTSGNEILHIDIENSTIFLSAPVCLVYKGITVATLH